MYTKAEREYSELYVSVSQLEELTFSYLDLISELCEWFTNKIDLSILSLE